MSIHSVAMMCLSRVCLVPCTLPDAPSASSDSARPAAACCSDFSATRSLASVITAKQKPVASFHPSATNSVTPTLPSPSLLIAHPLHRNQPCLHSTISPSPTHTARAQ